ncbi:hypothetical protein LX32DRAFT_371881 [Colletotrichum zoysiae]|uniref:Uncharacterized protein n=1 Tax=Colletotrichum zoysiae TaxID=1216348 RepID=A0AAD9HVC9_9PEZI|nr:hypothetical protein LX32DRAFT_371881 [Colletotrichum zoysiae]
MTSNRHAGSTQLAIYSADPTPNGEKEPNGATTPRTTQQTAIAESQSHLCPSIAVYWTRRSPAMRRCRQ